MDRNEKFPQQQAPEKNTDDAFVKVGSDGQPVMPGNANNPAHTESEKERDEKNDKQKNYE